ncbi:MAG: hypothetical protein Ta2A_13930 [Treponemataceae bacterium]|nr:MAG: hypothetical protein Ta2A_13930 [Treponemataceae bacterium]
MENSSSENDFEVSVEDGHVTITSYTGSAADVVIPETIAGNPVTRIADIAFSECIILTSVNIPDGVTDIGDGTFSDCIALTSVIIPASVTRIGDRAFRNCIGLTSVSIPDGVTDIGNGAFSFCTGLTSVNIGKSVTRIGVRAFLDCSGLTSISIPDGVTDIGGGTFGGCTGLTSVNISENVTRIGSGAFGHCTALTSVNIPDGVTEIGDAFEGCTALISEQSGFTVTTVGGKVIINRYTEKSAATAVVPATLGGNPVVEIGRRAFADCTALTSVNISENVTYIEDWAFSGCTALTTIRIPSSVIRIEDVAFSGCDGLSAIQVDANNQNYASRDGVLFNKTETELVKYPAGRNASHYAIPESVTGIGLDAFFNCTALTSVNISENVTVIDAAAFWGCARLTTINIPKSVTVIRNDAFYGCTALTAIQVDENNQNYASRDGVLFNKAVTELLNYPAGRNASHYAIPESVTVIGHEAFGGCSTLTSVNISENVTVIVANAFCRCTRLTSINIPESVTRIEDNAFRNCDGLSAIQVDANNQNYVSRDGVLFNKTETELVKYPAGRNARHYAIPESVTVIRSNAFQNCTRLTSINISESVTRIEDNAFRNCDGLSAIQVDENNQNYASRDGVLFNKAGTELIKYPEGRKASHYAIPESVTVIGSSAFSDCAALTSVNIPESVTQIWGGAFFYCFALSSISIGSNVKLAYPRTLTPFFENGFDNYYTANGSKAGTYTCCNDREPVMLTRHRKGSWSYAAATSLAR